MSFRESSIDSEVPQGLTASGSGVRLARWLRLLPISLGMLFPIFVVAGAAIHYGSLGTAVSVLVRGDEFLVYPSPLELNEVKPGSAREFHLVLRNFSRDDLTIVEGRTSCGCLEVPLTGQVVEAGGSTKVAGVFTSASDDIGAQSLTIRVWLDKCDQIVQIPVEVTFAAVLDVEP